MLQFLSNLLIKAYRKRSARLSKQADLQAKTAKALMDKAVSLRKQAGGTSNDSLIAAVTADRLSHLLNQKGLESKTSGKL